jgi:hypothetical protein
MRVLRTVAIVTIAGAIGTRLLKKLLAPSRAESRPEIDPAPASTARRAKPRSAKARKRSPHRHATP